MKNALAADRNNLAESGLAPLTGDQMADAVGGGW